MLLYMPVLNTTCYSGQAGDSLCQRFQTSTPDLAPKLLSYLPVYLHPPFQTWIFLLFPCLPLHLYRGLVVDWQRAGLTRCTRYLCAIPGLPAWFSMTLVLLGSLTLQRKNGRFALSRIPAAVLPCWPPSVAPACCWRRICAWHLCPSALPSIAVSPYLSTIPDDAFRPARVCVPLHYATLWRAQTRRTATLVLHGGVPRWLPLPSSLFFYLTCCLVRFPTPLLILDAQQVSAAFSYAATLRMRGARLGRTFR